MSDLQYGRQSPAELIEFDILPADISARYWVAPGRMAVATNG
ncbi:hypothetical protein NPIL_158391, partial [Nephila pilipes]